MNHVAKLPSMLFKRSAPAAWPALRELLVAQAVALVFLGFAAFELYKRIDAAASSQALNKKITHAYLLGPTITADLVRFALALVVLHAAVGLVGWLLSYCTDKAAPWTRRARCSLATIGLTAGLFAWVHVANAALYPWSVAGGGFSAFGRAQVGGISGFALFTLAFLSMVAAVVTRTLVRSRIYAVAGPRLFVYPLLLVLAYGTWRATSLAHAEEGVAPDRPNVILIGVDSLRPDAITVGGSVAVAPNMDRFLRESIRFEDTITPLARTFPSWLTMLTGRHPVATGARENLIAPASLQIPSTLGAVLQRSGYESVYATDDVRCSNIDRSYGFDTIIGPKMGALDFVLATANDLPLPNLVSNTWLGRWLFPYTYINRAAAITYEPGTFVREIESQVSFDRPTLLAIHLTLPHFPYYWASDNRGSLAETLRQPYMYSNSIIGVDRQIGDLLAMLERRGALRNAIVVLLSDHGEGLGLPKDNLLYDKAAKSAARGVTVPMWGHGNSALSSSQYQVVFAWRGFGAAALPRPAARSDFPASLEDLMPTVLDLIDVPAQGEFDGISLVPAMRDDADSKSAAAHRVRFTETGITMGFNHLGEAKVNEIVDQGMSAYAINPNNGRLELKAEFMAELMNSKERVAIGRDRILAAVPVAGQSMKYLVVPRSGGVPTFLETAPRDGDDPQVRRLWDALNARFPGELTPLPQS
jgi:arylsulfatase A-like enzyme